MGRVVGIVFFLIGAAAASEGQAAKITALRCGSLFDGRGDSLRKNVVIVVDGEKIKDVATSVPGGADVLDLSHSTCLPGLIDTRTHEDLHGR